jgi:DNA-binding NarL/FixJ family response regulator
MIESTCERHAARVTISYPHELIRKALAALIARQRNIEVVGESGSAEEMELLVRSHKPDVAVVDADLLDPMTKNGEVLGPFEASLDTRFLLLVADGTPKAIRRLFDTGACGVIPRNAQVGDLQHALESLISGHRYLHPALGAQLAQGHAATDPLTQHELEIARLITLGNTNREIAGRMFVSVRTVESHRASIKRKLRVNSRSDLVRWALDCKLIGATPIL